MSEGVIFGVLLKQQRNTRRLTHRELAKRSGLTVGAISNLERGLSQRPRIDTVEMLAKGLGLDEQERATFVAAARGWTTATFVLGPHNLLQDLPGFIGRESEVAHARQLIRENRLVTLTGTGGSGKTRLALAAAEGLLTDFPDGVFFVELAPLGDPALVADTIARTLGVHPTGQRPPLEGVREHLRRKRFLLLLDNFEHLRPAAPLLDALLDDCPALHIVVTSRVRLRRAAEVVLLVPPLDLPDPKQRPDPHVLAGYAAIALFAARAQSARQGVPLPLDVLPTVLQICRALDGLPLAIELAAARCAVLSPAEIRTRLSARLAVLARGRRGGPGRHASLDAALDWSYDLLTPGAQDLFRTLAVFVGGCGLAAVEAVAGAQIGTEAAILDDLMELVQQHLLRATPDGTGQTRYIMLETIRAYAGERVREEREDDGTPARRLTGDECRAASGEIERLRARHAIFFLARAETAEQALVGPTQLDWLDSLEVEHDNLRAALAWAMQREDAETSERLAGALWRFWYLRGYLIEGFQWLEMALAKGNGATASRCKALLGAGMLARHLGDHARARSLFTEGLHLCEATGDARGRAQALAQLGYLAAFHGDYALARERYAASAALCRASGDLHGLALALRYLGMAARERGERTAAWELHQEGLAIQRQVGDLHGTAHALQNLGAVARDLGDATRARAYHEESLTLYRRIGDDHGASMELNHLGILARDRADWASALAHHEEALAFYRVLGDPHGTAVTLHHLAKLAHARADTREAQRLFLESLTIRHQLGNIQGLIEAVEGLATVAGAYGQGERAARLYSTAETARATFGIQHYPGDKPWHREQLTAARALLSEDAYMAAWTAGAAIPLQDVIAEELPPLAAT